MQDVADRGLEFHLKLRIFSGFLVVLRDFIIITEMMNMHHRDYGDVKAVQQRSYMTRLAFHKINLAPEYCISFYRTIKDDYAVPRF